MLTRLTIRDFAVVSATEIEFGPGLTVVSGETGAGKSLLVDALGFLSGLRADSGMVRHGAERAELHAEFSVADAPLAAEWMRQQDFDDGDACTLRRTLRADGGSRAWINGRPATVAQLGELATRLVEIHGQHEHHALLDKPGQLALLDACGQHTALLAQVRGTAGEWARLQREHDLLSNAGDVSERIGWLEHQLSELDREELEPGAIAALIGSHRRHAHAASLITTCERALDALSGDDTPSLLRQLHQVRNELARGLDHEPGFADVDAMLDAAGIQLDEAALLLQRIHDDLDLDPAQLEQLDTRLQRVHDLARKHRVAPEELARLRQDLRQTLESLLGAGQRLASIELEMARRKANWQEAARSLSAARGATARRMGLETTRLIAELGMGGSGFDIQLEPVTHPDPDPLGAERVEFLVSANAGQPLRPLRRVASGGELARIALAIEVVALGSDPVPTMVFDEVDSGIGGAVAGIVGGKLRGLAGSRQVLCVTHLPQVAAHGHVHYHVSKAERDGVTRSAVRLLDPGQRQEELARMLGGVVVSEEARAAAGRMLDEIG